MVLKKHELESKLKEDQKLISSGLLRNEHPLDLSAQFEDFLQACRKGDLKTCQEMISAGVNINGKDQYDYTPLVIVSMRPSDLKPWTGSVGRVKCAADVERCHLPTYLPTYRRAYAGTMSSFVSC